MWMPCQIDIPHLIVHAGGVNDKLIAFPLTDGVAHPAGLRVFFGKLAAVGENLAAERIHFEQDESLAVGVHDFERIRQRAGLGNALRHTASFGIIAQ